MFKIKNVYLAFLFLAAILGGSQGVYALSSKDIALFSQPQKVSHRDFVILRNGQFRNTRASYGRPFLAGLNSPIIEKSDSFKTLSKAYEGISRLEDNIYKLEGLDLFDGKANEKFWSYVNSPTYRGGLAYRQSIAGEDYEWPDYKREFDRLSPEQLLQSGRTHELSAAAKYDYLLGEQTNIFTGQVSYAESVYRRFGKVSHWAGICHGTAPASFMYPEPLNEVRVKGFNGEEIEFSVADIKRLSAHIWGENPVSIVQVGTRCRQDELGSRQRNCLDTNPATFHLALLNYMGIYKKTFVIDNAYDSMVWNKPVVSYKYQFRNPNTKLPSRELKYSMLKIEDLEADPYAQFRSPRAKYVVGVQMTVGLLYGEEDRDRRNLNSAYDIVYYYDLEIDENGKIVGGEWETQYHPDFIWTVKEGSSPRTSEDFFIKERLWDGKQPLPNYVRSFGRKASKRGDLLEYIVKSLLSLSRNQGEQNDNYLQ